MKRTILSLFCLFSLLSATAQVAKVEEVGERQDFLDKPAVLDVQDTLDRSAILECFYLQVDIDTVAGKSRDEVMVLQIGKQYSLYQTEGFYAIDSLCYAMNNQLTSRQYQATSRKFRSSNRSRYSRNLATNLISEQRNIVLNRWRYYDSTAVFNWQLYDDTMTVCGHRCRKAVATFRGHTWTAWYAEDIPLDAGPWKLHGLPGLILAAANNKGTHTFTAVTLREAKHPCLTLQSRRVNKITRAAYFEREEDYAVNFQDHRAAVGIIPLTKKGEAPRPTRGFYAPFEDL